VGTKVVVGRCLMGYDVHWVRAGGGVVLKNTTKEKTKSDRQRKHKANHNR